MQTAGNQSNHKLFDAAPSLQPSLLKKWVLALASVFVTAPTTPSRNIACTSYILSSGNTGFGGFECDRLVLPTVVIKIRKMEAFSY